MLPNSTCVLLVAVIETEKCLEFVRPELNLKYGAVLPADTGGGLDLI